MTAPAAIVDLTPDWPAEGEAFDLHVPRGAGASVLAFDEQIADFLRRGHKLRVTFECAIESELFRFWMDGGRPS